MTLPGLFPRAPKTRQRKRGFSLRDLTNWQFVGIALALIIAFSVAVFTFVEGYDAWEALYVVLCSLMFAHCDEAFQPLTKVASILIVIGTWSALSVLFEYGMDNFLKLELHGKRNMKYIEKMNGHAIIAGYGSLGKTVGDALADANADFVIVEKDAKIIAKLKAEDIPHVEGDALDSKTLKQAGLQRAKTLIGALSTDADNVFLTLTAKEISPTVTVATRATTEQSVGKLHRAGAEIIVMPEIIGGLELAKEVLNLRPDEPSKYVSRK